jgi:hypothetical protein
LRMRVRPAYLLPLFAALLLTSRGSTQVSHRAPVLVRDIDKRPLPIVTNQSLSAKMQKAVQSFIAEAKRDAPSEDALQPLKVTMYRIPAAPHDHKLYLVDLSVCAPAGVNCSLAVFDETPASITKVVEGQLASILVIRRPNLLMPDIGANEQMGHFGNVVKVYRFDLRSWSPYMCKQTSITGDDDPHPKFLADAPCTPEL